MVRPAADAGGRLSIHAASSAPFRRARRARAWLVASLAGATALAVSLAHLPGQAVAQTTDGSVMTAFGAAPSSFADVVDKVKGSVVSIYVAGNRGGADGNPEIPFAFPDLPNDHPLNEFFKQFKRDKEGQGQATPTPPSALAQGSGFIISADGYVVTNNHVVDGASKVEVSFDENERLEADVIGTDPRTDLALLKIKKPGSYPAVGFAEKPVRVGDWVLAVGNPFGLGGTVTAGIVSARGRDIGSGPYDYLQIDAAVNRGNSGGPAFNLVGEVVGINTAIFSPSGGNVGIAFAVPADLAKQVIEQLKTSGSVRRGWLGVHIQNVTDDMAKALGMSEPAGALITKITEDGPAAKGKLEVGDTVVAVNGEKIGNSRDLARKIADLPPDTNAALMVLRDGKETEISVLLGLFPGSTQIASLDEGKAATPETKDMAELGLSLAPASALAAQKGGEPQEGVLITRVEASSEAAEKGLVTGDIILEVAGEKVATPGDVVTGVDGAKSRGRKAVLLRVKSADGEKFVALTIDKS